MTRRGFWVLLFWLIALALLCKACIVRDVITDDNSKKVSTHSTLAQSYPSPKNIKLNGVDYLQS
jgi:hypothetical protein